MAKFKPSILTTTFTFILITTFAQSQDSRKLDETTPPDLNNKCGNCPCNQPCTPTPTLPPPTPSPPPPSPPPPSPPPPKKNPPSNINCPPPPDNGNTGGGGGGGGSGGGGSQYPPSGGNQYPPNPPYIYVNGPPGNIYPVAPYLSGSGRIGSMGFVQVVVILGAIAFW